MGLAIPRAFAILRPMTEQAKKPSARIALFVTCLVDLFRPSVGFAAVKLLEDAGYTVEVPSLQTCCGQPAFNSGDTEGTRAIAKQVIEVFQPYDYVVVPSGSCGGTIKVHYPDLFADDRAWEAQAQRLADKTYELTTFLTEIAGVQKIAAKFPGLVTYHDSCASLREMGCREQPRQLLAGVTGLELNEMEETEVCCGFGGTFCVKYPEISERMVSDKVENIRRSGVQTVLAGDLGCLLNIAGRIKRLELPIRAYHVAEILADMGEGPAIGETEESS